jgi:hypothetical protein
MNKSRSKNGGDGQTGLVTIRPGVVVPEDIIPVLESSRSLQEITPEDALIPWYFFNMSLKGQDGKWLPKEQFFHSLREDTRASIDCTLLFLHKTHRYAIFEEAEGTKILCSSLDRITGHWRETGETLECATCEYAPIPAHWKNGTPPPCKLIWTFVGFDEAHEEPFAISAKSTSMTPAKRFLNTHFIGKFKGRDLPLFVYKVRLSLTQPTGTYAVLQFEVTGMNTPEEIKRYAALAEALIGSSRINFEAEQPEETGETGDGMPF